MKKIILVTGATDGIGLATAKMLVAEGHHVLIHGRNAQKLSQVEAELNAIPGAGDIQSYRADLSSLHKTAALADAISAQHNTLDVIINNAGVYKVGQITSVDNLDVRFVVNAIAPYLLTQRLMPVMFWFA
uniref:SDR family NAD(P)-dependent oxidoreductase n=1 Tax=Shewanella sp. TaxID=50422 RepID=UPI004048D4B5